MLVHRYRVFAAMVLRLVLFCSLFVLRPPMGWGEEGLPWSQVENSVRRYFAANWNDKQINLMTQGHASLALRQLDHLGWQVEDQKDILKGIPADSDYLIQVLSSASGQKLLKHLPNEELLYDRLDRIIKQPGGRRLVRDMLKLPDGYRYAKANRPRGVPAMNEFLPKTRKGKDQVIRNYGKPTGRIYTLDQFITRLHESHDELVAKASKKR